MSVNLNDWAKQYPSVRRFEKLIERGRLTPTTYNRYLLDVKRFCDLLGNGDAEDTLEKIRRLEEKEDFFDKLITNFRDQGMTDSRISSIFMGVKWWLSLNHIDVDWRDVILPSLEAQEEDRAPTKEELKSVLNVCNLRDKALIEVASSSGLRRGTLATLKVGDVNFDYPDVARILVKKVYTIKDKVFKSGRKISKKRTFYVTFISPEAKRILQEYLEYRKKQGETITEESPLFTSTRKRELGQFLTKNYICVHWGRLLKRAFLTEKSKNWHVLHFHTLKKYAETQFINAGVTPSYREFWLGHKGAYLEASYFRGEEQKHLEEYRKAISHLTILEAQPIISKEELRKEIFAQLPSELLEPMAQKYGMKPEALRNILMHTKLSEEEKEAMIKEEFEGPGLANPKVYMKKIKEEKEDCQKLIDPSELEQYLSDGWRYIAQVNGKIIVEK